MADSMPEESESKSTSDDDVDPLSYVVNSDGMIEFKASALLEAVKESSRQDMKSWMEL